MGATFEVTNLIRADNEVDAAMNVVRRVVEATIFTHANLIISAAKKRAPVKTGTLRSTGHVEPPMHAGKDVVIVRLGFGGPAAIYAHYQHGQGFAPGDDRPRLVTWQSGYTKPFHKREGEGYLYYPFMADIPLLREALKVAIDRVGL
jgi:hypothetical protein